MRTTVPFTKGYKLHTFLADHNYGHLNMIGVRKWEAELDARIKALRLRYPKL